MNFLVQILKFSEKMKMKQIQDLLKMKQQNQLANKLLPYFSIQVNQFLGLTYDYFIFLFLSER